MSNDPATKPEPLRILHIEDNPLIVSHVEQMLENLGHPFVGSFDSFAALRAESGELAFDSVARQAAGSQSSSRKP